MNTINKIFCVLMTAAVVLVTFALANAMHNDIHSHQIANDTTIIRAAEVVPLTPATDDDGGFGIVLQEVYFVDGEPMLYGKHVDFDSETADFMRYVLSDGCLVDTTKYPIAAVAYDDGYRYWVELD